MRARGVPAAPTDAEAAARDADAEAVARRILLTQLTSQPRSRAELAGRLAAKAVPSDVAERTLRRFEEVGLVDDDRFARAWVQSRQSSRGLGRRALAHELRGKGVPDDVVKDALGEVDAEAEIEAARRLVRRRMGSVSHVDHVTAVRRLTGMLARKGHPAALSLRVVREELAAARDSSASGDLAEEPEPDGDILDPPHSVT